MRFALHETDSGDGRLFDVGLFTQRVVPVAGAREAAAADEVLYVLEGSGHATIGSETHVLEAGTSVFVSGGTAWSADGEGRAVSVLVHDPVPGTATHAVVDLTAVEKGTATAGRQFVLGARPETGCASVTQFIGLVPPGRAPDHFHTYDEVIYILEGEGELHIDGEQAALRPGRASTSRRDSSTASPTRATPSCDCSASSDLPDPRPRPTTPTARSPSPPTNRSEMPRIERSAQLQCGRATLRAARVT